MPQKPNHYSGAIAALLLLSVIWGYNWVVMKLALTDIGAFQFGAIRTFFGALVLLVTLKVLRKPLKPMHLRMTVLLGLLQTAGFTGLIIWALVEGGAGKTAVLSFTMPFWVMILAWPLLGEKLRGMQWLTALLSVSGLVFILEPWNLHGGLLSNFLAVFAGICWAVAVILAKKLHQRAPELDLLSFTGWQMLFGSLPRGRPAGSRAANPLEQLSAGRRPVQRLPGQWSRLVAVDLRPAQIARRRRQHQFAADPGDCRAVRLAATGGNSICRRSHGDGIDRHLAGADRRTRHSTPRAGGSEHGAGLMIKSPELSTH